jgi:hypothetical protein
LTIENRGDAPARGRYRLRVAPASAARLAGPTELKVMLKPGERMSLETTVAATGRSETFCVEAVAEGEALLDSFLFWELAR